VWPHDTLTMIGDYLMFSRRIQLNKESCGFNL